MTCKIINEILDREKRLDISMKQGDCLKLMKEIPEKSIDMILCDLPYGTSKCSWDSIIPLDKLWIEYKRIIKDFSKNWIKVFKKWRHTAENLEWVTESQNSILRSVGINPEDYGL